MSAFEEDADAVEHIPAVPDLFRRMFRQTVVYGTSSWVVSGVVWALLMIVFDQVQGPDVMWSLVFGVGFGCLFGVMWATLMGGLLAWITCRWWSPLGNLRRYQLLLGVLCTLSVLLFVALLEWQFSIRLEWRRFRWLFGSTLSVVLLPCSWINAWLLARWYAAVSKDEELTHIERLRRSTVRQPYE